jgi:hypothetical protein
LHIQIGFSKEKPNHNLKTEYITLVVR